MSRTSSHLPTTGTRARALVRRATAALAVATTSLSVTVAISASPASAVGPTTTTLFEESFAGSTTGVPSWVMPSGSSGNAACLTAGSDYGQQPIPSCYPWWMEQDPAGEGVLRLTALDYGSIGAAFYDAGLPSAQGIDVSFDSYQWGWGGVMPADGITFMLAATDPANPSAPEHLGSAGGGIGYAPFHTPGLPHAYLGVGLDVVGNFSVDAGSGCGPTVPQAPAVVVRGPGNGTNGYCQLAATPSNGALDKPHEGWSRPRPVPVQVVLNPEDHVVLSSSGDTVPARSWFVAWTPYDADRQTSSGPLPTAEDLATAEIPTDWYDPQTLMPYQLSFGWAGTTGAGYSFHAVGNVRATTLAGQLPKFGLAVSDSASGSFTSGQPGTVSVTASLDATGGDETRPATVTTTLPAGLVPTNPVVAGYDCTTQGQVVSCTTTGTTYAAGTDLPTIPIPVTPGEASLGLQPITSKVSSTDGNPATARHDITVRAAQAITFAPLPAPALVGSSHQLVATGGGSTAPVTFALGSGTTEGACTLADGVLELLAAGTCVVTADQSGDDTHAAAPPVSQAVTVERVTTSTTVALAPGSTVVGQPATATATVTGSPSGTVQFQVDGEAVGDAVILADGTATSVPLTATGGNALTPGTHPVTAVFTPTDTTTYAGSTSTPQTLTVAQAATTTSVTVSPHSLTARVQVTAPGSGPVGGSVSFSVDGRPIGTAEVVEGVATLAYTTPADQTRQVAATYTGSATLLASSGSTARSNPVVTARVSSASARSGYGWYRSAVTVTFTCTPGSAPLAAACPSPVTLSRNGASQLVTRTVAATDGGVATVAVGGLNIDATSPTAKVSGAAQGARYFAASPSVRCVGADALSGLASCTVRKQRAGQVETVTATAVDKAGNKAVASVKVTVVPIMVSGAPYSAGAYTVRKGRTYTLLVASSTRPRYVDAAPYPRAPKGLDHYFTKVGPGRWALGVTMDRTMRTGYWNLGVKIGSTTHAVKVHVKP